MSVTGALQGDSAVFYHPLDSNADSAGLPWAGNNFATPMQYSPTGGKVGGYAYPQSGGSACDRSGYGNMVGASRMTVAFWATNLTDDIEDLAIVGYWSTSTVVPAQLFYLHRDGTVDLYVGTEAWNSPVVTHAAAVSMYSGWGFYVLDAERSGGNWIIRHSVNGAPWTAEAGVTHVAFTGSPDISTILIRGGAVTMNKIDEVILWKDAELFTTEELSNLYDLADTFSAPMNQYEDHYSAPICWQATAAMPDGAVWRDSGSGPCPPVLRVPRGAADIVVTDEGRRVAPRIVEG